MWCASNSSISAWWWLRSSRAAPTASYDADTNLLTLRCGTQSVGSMRAAVAGAMNIKPEQLRVQQNDVGGAFGMKGSAYPEYIAMLHAARELQRPVHWLSTRSEAFVTDNQGRDIAVDRGTRAEQARAASSACASIASANMGAYFTAVAHFIVTLHISGCLPTSTTFRMRR